MYTHEFKFKNGETVEEKITGFRGIITGTCFYLTGCNQYLITPKAVDNKTSEGLWYDEDRLTLVDKEAIELQPERNGCDIPPTIGLRGS